MTPPMKANNANGTVFALGFKVILNVIQTRSPYKPKDYRAYPKRPKGFALSLGHKTDKLYF